MDQASDVSPLVLLLYGASSLLFWCPYGCQRAVTVSHLVMQGHGHQLPVHVLERPVNELMSHLRSSCTYALTPCFLASAAASSLSSSLLLLASSREYPSPVMNGSKLT